MILLHSVDLVPRAGARFARFTVRLIRALQRVIIARATRRALNALHDDLLRDVGLTRGDILFVADALASRPNRLTRNALDHLGASAGEPDAPVRLPSNAILRGAYCDLSAGRG